MPHPPQEDAPLGFDDLGLAEAVLAAVRDVGYESPSPIQRAAIPPLLEGRDVLGQAQTGTGKTAAFALPLLSRLDLQRAEPQLLVLTPTRELAIQVAEAMQTYARHLKGFHVLPVYGGQGMDFQLRQLRRGVHAVVGTPGRIQDHLRRKTLKLDRLKAVVIDEADEMLRMGFIEDVEDILEHMPEEKQVALFSATMPDRIRKIVQHHLSEPVEIRIKDKTATVASVDQRFVEVRGFDKLEALTRILEVEEFDAMLIFVRTRSATTELAEKLEARGLDVERVTHVVNYDIPHDVEGYIHRIGRTGRAGRAGHAILFVTPRERRMLTAIERATRQPITPMSLPTRADVAHRRAAQFKQLITEVLAAQDLVFFEQLVASYEQEHGKAPLQIAAALAYLAQKDRPLQLPAEAERPAYRESPQSAGPGRRERAARAERFGGLERPDERRAEHGSPGERPGRPAKPPAAVELYARPEGRRGARAERSAGAGPPRGSVRYRIAVGREHGVQPGNIVGAIANEAGIDSVHIGRIDIYDAYSTVDLPEGMPTEIYEQLQKTWVCGQKLAIRVDSAGDETATRRPPPTGRPERRPPKKHRKGTPSAERRR